VYLIYHSSDSKSLYFFQFSEILKESRSVLYGDEVEVSSVLNNVLTLLNRMDTRLSTIEKKTGKNTVTLNQKISTKNVKLLSKSGRRRVRVDNYPLSGTSTRDYKMYISSGGGILLVRGFILGGGSTF
jgi:hypothetical protein